MGARTQQSNYFDALISMIQRVKQGNVNEVLTELKRRAEAKFQTHHGGDSPVQLLEIDAYNRGARDVVELIDKFLL